MTQKSINLGTADKGNGDPLRVAFGKVNDNFTELYTALGLIDNSLNLGAFEFTGSTISTTDSTPVVIDQATTITSNLTVGGDILPSVANGVDLGSSTLPWRSLYVSNNTIFLGGIALSVDAGGNLLVDGSLVTGGGSSVTTSATAPADPSLGDLWYDTASGRTYVYYDASWVDASPVDGVGITSYNDLTNKPTLFSGSYTDLTNKPNLGGTYQFSVAADDSTQRLISTDEVIKFVGAGGVTTASDAEGNITITGTIPSSLVNGAKTFIFDSNGVITVTGSYSQNPATFKSTAGFQLNKTYASGVQQSLLEISNYVGITVGMSDDPDNPDGKSWAFKTDGDLEIPGNICSQGNINIDINLSDSTLRRWQFGEDGELTFPEGYLKIVPNGANPYISNRIDNGLGLVSGSAIQIRQSVADAYGISIDSSTTDTSLGGGALLATGSNIDVNGSKIVLGKYTTNYLDADTGLTGQNKIEINQDEILIGQYVSTFTSGVTSSTFNGWTFEPGVTEASSKLIFPDSTVQTTAYNPNSIRSEGDINIEINLSDSTLRRWQFGEDGHLTLPSGGNISEGGGFTGAIRLTPAGGANANQALLIYPTAGAPEGDHIHLTAGGGSTELYLGDDYHYVKLVDGGNVEVKATTANFSATAAWTFGTDGSLASDDEFIIKTPNGVPTSVYSYVGGGGWNSPPYSNLATTTNGSGTGLTVNVSAANGGYIDISVITINVAGTGYKTGDIITITNENNLTGTFAVGVSGTRNWTFGIDGALTLPSGNSSSSGIQSVQQNNYQSKVTVSPFQILSQARTNQTQSYSAANGDFTSAASDGNGMITFVSPAGAIAEFFTDTFDYGGAYEPTVRLNGTGPEYGYSSFNGTDQVSLAIAAPAGAVTSIRFSYTRISKIDIDTDNDVFRIESQPSLDIDIQSGRHLDLVADNHAYMTAGTDMRLRSGNSSVMITTNYNIANATPQDWIFSTGGDLTLPNGAVLRNTVGDAIAFGNGAGQNSQGNEAVAIGTNAGYDLQGIDAVAIGTSAGETAQGEKAVAIGDSSGYINQGDYAVAIGHGAGNGTQGSYAVAIGTFAGQINQTANSIIINASGSGLDSATAGFYVKPVRQGETADAMYYNSSTGEITYAGVFSFNVAADDSTQRTISNNELIKFIGAGGITTASDAEGYITITGPSAYTLPTATTSVLGGVKVDGTSITIDGSGVISLNAGLAGAVTFKGGWDANTNTPTLANGTGTSGWMYIVTVGGTQDLGAGSATYAASDLLVYDGTSWIQVAANTGVVTFNTRRGAITLTDSDVTTALGYTPYNATNPSAYLTAITSGNVTSALGYTPIQASSLSVSTAAAAGAGSLSYSNGVFTFTPAAAYTLPTATTSVLGGVKIDNTTITISSGVISVSSALTSAVQFKGGWNASTNTPALSASLPAGLAAGWQYIVSDAGTRDIGSGSISYAVNDLVIYNGTNWIRIPGSSSVISFNTRQGAITLESGDVTTALGSTTANYILAAPNGTNGTASFRAAVLADISNLGAGVATFLATPTSSNLLSAITDETGTGKVLFSTSPQVTTSITTDSSSFNLLNATATTVNFAGGATTLSMGAATGTASVNNATVTLTNATTVNVNGANPTLASTSTGTLTLFNTNLLTVNAFNAATTATLANSATTLGIGNTATAAQTVNMFTASTGASTYNFATGATANATIKSISIGTSGVSGSTTNIALGSAVSGATGTTTINTALTVNPATTGTVTIGVASGTGTITLGLSTVSQTVNIAAGATASGSTKTIAIGTTGLSGSTTNISIGSAVSGATSALTFGGAVADAAATSTAKSVGYLGTPINTQAGTYTLVIGDTGKTIYAGGNLTIPANASVAFPVGTIINVIASAGITVAITSDTLQWGGQSTSQTGTRTVAIYGMATLVKVTNTIWYISGVGVT